MPAELDTPIPDGFESLMGDLTPPQRAAALHTEGPLLVLAAAGSGKTRVITRRIAYLVGIGVPPWQILALTFTNKAAGEMRERVAHLMAQHERQTRGLTITTFHSLGARLLRRYAEGVNLKPEFSIYNSGDQATLVKRVIETMQLSTSNWPARSVLGAISEAKNKLLDAEAYAARAMDFYAKTIAKIFAGYQTALRAAGAVDFDDLLVLTAKLLRDNSQAREECNARWRYLMIDEYQDTNHAQFVIASLLAGKGEPNSNGPNICVVGDPDQAIYGWRGADIGNILDFEENYPKARVIALGENFRSTAPILAVADTLIRRNVRRKHKDLFTRRAGGAPIEVTICRDEHHEAALVTDWFKSLHEHRGEGPAVEAGIAWRDMAVFYRTNALSRVMEDAFRAAAIPYTIARGTAFYEREEIKSALAYLRLVANPSDNVSLERIVNTPARGLGNTTLARVEIFAQQNEVQMLEALRSCARGEDSGINARAASAAGKFVELIDGWTGGGTFLGASVGASLAELVERVIKESGLEEMYRKQAAVSKSEADDERVDNLAELISSAREFEMEFDAASDPAEPEPFAPETPPLLAMLRAYLESVALVADADTVDPSQGAVTMMTLHAAKGLEFPAVAMIGLEEGLLPHSRAAESESQLEEERRLCFVGITRAMRRLLITSAKYRTNRGISERTIPSRFLGEFGTQHVRVSDQSDTFGGHDSGGDHDERSVTRGALPSTAPARATRSPSPVGNASYAVGTLVRHPQFGLGRIKSVISGSNARAVIDFQAVGTKTLVLEYARLQRV